MSSTSTGFATVSVLLVIVMIRHAVHIPRKNHQWMNQFQRNEKNQKRLCSADGWWPTRSFLFSTCWMRQFHECSRNDLTVTKLCHDRFGRDMRLFIDFACGWTLFVDTMGHAPCWKIHRFFAKEILGYGTSADARRRVKRNVRLQGRQKNAIGQMGSCHVMPCHATLEPVLFLKSDGVAKECARCLRIRGSWNGMLNRSTWK